MSKGLEKILKKIREHPNRKVLRERYLALVSEIESSDERQTRMLDLGNVFYNIDPSESMQIAHQVYRQNKKSIQALKLIKLCLDKLGRKGKAEIIDKEIQKLEAEEGSDDLRLPPLPSSPPSLIPSSSPSSAIGSEEITTITQTKDINLPPLPHEQTLSPNYAETSDTQVANEYSPKIPFNTNKTPSFEEEAPLTTPIEPNQTASDSKSSLDPEQRFAVPSLTQLQRELHQQSDNFNPSANNPKDQLLEVTEPAPTYTDPFESLHKPSSETTEIDDSNLTDLPQDSSYTKKHTKISDSNLTNLPQDSSYSEKETKISNNTAADTLKHQSDLWQPDITTPPPPQFSSKPEFPLPRNTYKKTDLPKTKPNTPLSALSKNKANPQLLGLLDSLDISQFLQSNKEVEETRATPPLPDTFKRSFQNWYRLKEPLNTPNGEALLWEFIQAIWAQNPQKEAAVFLTQTNLAHQSEGLWGTFLDGLIAAKYYRKVVFEIRQKILKDPNPRWSRVGLPRLNIACSALGFKKLCWKEQEGMEELCKLLSKQFCLNEFLVTP
ncbi:MAG: hypothetical protein AB8G05_19760 [Oligoflexales bacterium]